MWPFLLIESFQNLQTFEFFFFFGSPCIGMEISRRGKKMGLVTFCSFDLQTPKLLTVLFLQWNKGHLFAGFYETYTVLTVIVKLSSTEPFLRGW